MFGMEMGNATILFHCVLVLLQIIILRKNFRWINLLQIVVGIVFGKFTTLCNHLLLAVPKPDHLLIQLCMMILSCFLIALGIFFYLPANIMPLAGEGAMQAIAEVTHIDFPKVKVAFDVSMVTISLIVCLVTIHRFGSVGIGTVIAAFLVGTMLGWIRRGLEPWRVRLVECA